MIQNSIVPMMKPDLCCITGTGRGLGAGRCDPVRGSPSLRRESGHRITRSSVFKV